METKIGEENQIIAEFMGYSEDVQKGDAWCRDFDWNWSSLMPVVEKIESLGYRTTIMRTEDLQEMIIWDSTPTYQRQAENMIVQNYPGQCFNKIEVVYKSIIKFIRWYNTTKQDQTQQPVPPPSPQD